MISASKFRQIPLDPLTRQDVIWPGLEPDFHRLCSDSLVELTHLCRSALRQPVFYVGAGVSYAAPSRLPIARQVLTSVFEQCQVELESKRVLEKPASDEIMRPIFESVGRLQMETILQHLYEGVFPRPFQTGRVFDVPAVGQRSNVNHRFLAQWLAVGHRTVVTTNLDPLIEQAWDRLYPTRVGTLHVIKRPDDFSDWKSRIDAANTLWKLHGSADDPESWAITLPKVAFELQDSRKDFLMKLIKTRDVCFIGYSAADIDLMPSILAAQRQKLNTSPRIFWAFYFNDTFQSLQDYLQAEPNVRRVFDANPGRIMPLVTTAERLCIWLETQCLNTYNDNTAWTATSPVTDEYTRWLAQDIQTAGPIACVNLVAFALRALGRHQEAVDLLDQIASKQQNRLSSSEIVQVAALLQESAHTYWQADNVIAALERVNQAWDLLRESEDVMSRVQCQYGRVTMVLDAKHDVTRLQRVLATLRLFMLHRWYWRLSRERPTESSPIIGQGLCFYYEAKIAETISIASKLIRLHPIRVLLVKLYERAEKYLRAGDFPQSIPDVKRRRALIRLIDEPEIAIQDMINAMEIARTVGQSHLELTVERAIMLLSLLQDAALRRRLMVAIDEFRRFLPDSHK